jgi:integrase
VSELLGLTWSDIRLEDVDDAEIEFAWQVDRHGQRRPTKTDGSARTHSFRHTVASRALVAGESIDEVAFLLGHRDANVTRAVYVRELADARRRSMRRSRMIAEFGELFRQ